MATVGTGIVMVDGVAYAPVTSAPAEPVASSPVMGPDGRFVPVTRSAERAARYTCDKHPEHSRNGRAGYSLAGIVSHQAWCDGSATLAD